jgi:hypothetical protein
MRQFHYDEAQLFTTFHGVPETTLAVRENQESGADCEQTDNDLTFLAAAGNLHPELVQAVNAVDDATRSGDWSAAIELCKAAAAKAKLIQCTR